MQHDVRVIFRELAGLLSVEPVDTLSKENLYSMIAKGIVENAKLSEQLADAEAERDELREAVLALGTVVHDEGYSYLEEWPLEETRDEWNALVAKLRAEEKT